LHSLSSTRGGSNGLHILNIAPILQSFITTALAESFHSINFSLKVLHQVISLLRLDIANQYVRDGSILSYLFPISSRLDSFGIAKNNSVKLLYNTVILKD
jgi:hypothetical protein